jgi:hypothetical protein
MELLKPPMMLPEMLLVPRDVNARDTACRHKLHKPAQDAFSADAAIMEAAIAAEAAQAAQDALAHNMLLRRYDPRSLTDPNTRSHGKTCIMAC